MSDTTYNGWSNYETWLVNLWLDNDGYDFDETARDATQQAIDNDQDKADAERALADTIEEMVEEMRPEVSGLFAELLNASLSNVAWREIAANHLSDVTVYSAGWNMPGYMPDNAPTLFLDADDALEYVKDSAAQWLENQDCTNHEWLENELTEWKADNNGEFGQTFGQYHYFVTIV